MSLLEVLQLVGYSTAAALHFWIAAMLFKRRRALRRLERVLLVLALTLGVWHTSNLLVSLRSMLGLTEARWAMPLRLIDTIAVISITLTYSLLLHVHLHLRAEARKRALTWGEHARVYLSYLPAVFLAYAVPKLWTRSYAYRICCCRLRYGRLTPCASWRRRTFLSHARRSRRQSENFCELSRLHS